MGDTTGTATLVLDAEASKFLVEMAKASMATKPISEGVKEAGMHMHKLADFGKEVVNELTGFAIPLSATAATLMLIGRATESWKETLKSTQEVMKEIAGLHQVIHASGRGGQVGIITKEINEGAGNLLSDDQKKSFYSGYVGAEGNVKATSEQIGRGARAAARAGALGRDPNTFGRVLGGLDAAHVPDAPDLANYLLQYVGDEQSTRAMELIAKNPDQATDIAQLFAAGARGGRGTRTVLNKASGEFARFGGKGSFRQFIQSHGRRIAGRDGLDDLGLLMTSKPPEFSPGGLESQFNEMVQDPIVKAQLENKFGEETAKEILAEQFGDRANKKTIKEGYTKAAESTYATGFWGDLWDSAMRGLGSGPLGGVDADKNGKMIPLHVTETPQETLNRRLGELHSEVKGQSELMQEANEQNARTRLRRNAQSEDK